MRFVSVIGPQIILWEYDWMSRAGIFCGFLQQNPFMSLETSAGQDTTTQKLFISRVLSALTRCKRRVAESMPLVMESLKNPGRSRILLEKIWDMIWKRKNQKWVISCDEDMKHTLWWTPPNEKNCDFIWFRFWESSSQKTSAKVRCHVSILGPFF